MKNVLIVTGANLGRGGVQAFLMKWFNAAGSDMYKFTWYFPGRILSEEYAEQFRNMDIEIIPAEITDLPRKQRNKKFYNELVALMSKNKYDIIHINTGVIEYQYYAIRAAKKNKITLRIVHSHNALTENKKHKRKNNYLRWYLRKNATICAGCSREAGIWMFGEKIIYNRKWKLIKNTIDTDKFIFNKAIRTKRRNELGIGEDYLLVSVGNLNKQKNQSFLIDVITCLKEMPYKTKLIILGDGPDKDILKSKAIENGVAKDIIFYGMSDSVNEWLQASDILVMPSIYEGSPIATLEGQAAGLPCLLSDSITKEVKVMDNVYYIPINDSMVWANAIADIIERYKQDKIDRKIDIERLRNAEYTDDCIMDNIYSLYES